MSGQPLSGMGASLLLTRVIPPLRRVSVRQPELLTVQLIGNVHGEKGLAL